MLTLDFYLYGKLSCLYNLPVVSAQIPKDI